MFEFKFYYFLVFVWGIIGVINIFVLGRNLEGSSLKFLLVLGGENCDSLNK